VARHWAKLEGPEIYGCDQNPELVEWCSRNLPFMSTSVNEVEPPTPYEDESFDLVYALSVLTHLPEELQSPWMAEFRRILRPDGLLLFTTLGERAKDRADARDRADFEAGRLVVKRAQLPGSNLCTVLHPYAYVTNGLLEDFSLLNFSEAASPQGQDTYLARRR
jgi:SAM-dependent methyltransferase